MVLQRKKTIHKKMGPLRKGKNSIGKIDVLIRNLHNKEKTSPPN